MTPIDLLNGRDAAVRRFGAVLDANALPRALAAVDRAERGMALAAELIADEVAGGRSVPEHMVETYRKRRAAVGYAVAVSTAAAEQVAS